jgi:hypothetical protein
MLFSQDKTKIYWNSLSTELVTKVPIADDESLENGQVQISVRFSGSKKFQKTGEPVKIEKSDIDDIKEVSISADIFEAMDGFSEGVSVEFKTEIWDRVGNSALGEIGDSLLTIDETIPVATSLTVTSSNKEDPLIANPEDLITFILNVNEPIRPPSFIINDDEFKGELVSDKSWKYIYNSENAEDGLISFEVIYEDIAKNPGLVLTKGTNSEEILFDGTPPKLTDIKLFTSNRFDNLMAKELDTAFIGFTSSEKIKNIQVNFDGKSAIEKPVEGLVFSYFYVFTKTDSDGVVPISIFYEDIAGNKGEIIDETSDDSFVTLDMSPPTVSKVQTIESAFDGSSRKKIKSSKKKLKNSKQSNEDIFGIPILYLIIGLSVIGLLFLITWLSFIKIFSKGGESGWKALIPFFAIFIWVKILKKPIWWLAIYLILPIGYIILALDTSKLFGKKIIYTVGLIFLPFVFYPMVAFGKSELGDKPAVKKAIKNKTKKK